jgi:hypothetical protein
VVLHFRPRTPIGRGIALRARSVGVQVAPRTPSCFALRASQDLQCPPKPWRRRANSRPATPLVWRSACRADERGSKPRQVAILLRAARFAGLAVPSEALAEEGHLGVAQPAERPLREREAAGARPATQSNSRAPLAQLAERSAYTRRELRTGARMEVRILQGVPSCFALRASQDSHPRQSRSRMPSEALAKEGSRTRQRNLNVA